MLDECLCEECLFNLKTNVKDTFIVETYQKIFFNGTAGVQFFFSQFHFLAVLRDPLAALSLCLCANGDELVSQSGTKTPLLGGQTQLMALGRESFVCVCVR